MKKTFLYFLIFLLLLAFSFRQLFTDFSTNLIDSRDYPYYVWVIYQNINHIKSLDFANFFNTNAYYPNTNTLFLSDILLPQSIIALPFTFIVNNPITVFNILFTITISLNYLSSGLVWKSLFKKDSLVFIGAFLTTFSPFFHIQISHFQMISYWPFFLSFYFLLKNGQNTANYFLAGFFLAVQFLASAYLGIFLAFAILLLTIIKYLKNRDVATLKRFGIIFLTFLILDGVFIIGYLKAMKQFGIVRNYSEYVVYSAHLSDYLFSKSLQSLPYQAPVFSQWNSFSKHNLGEATSFPGITLSVLAFLGLFTIALSRNKLSININLGNYRLLFLLLILVGFVFSLGPRLQFNGNLDFIPLPYHIVAKTPLLNSIRVPMRWSFVFYFGLTFFALEFLKKTKKQVLAAFIFLILLEYAPLKINTERVDYITEADVTLKTLCRNEQKVVLEIPVTHFDAKGGLAKGLSYITQRELATLYHGCTLVNGYSGYDLPSIQKIKNDIYNSLVENKSDDFYEALKTTRADFFVFHLDNLPEETLRNATDLVKKLENENTITHLVNNIYKIN